MLRVAPQQHTMVNVAGQCLGRFHGLIEEAISRSMYEFITIEEIVFKTSIRLLDVQYTLADMREAHMVHVKNNRVSFTAKMKRAKDHFQ